jgi:class 3 adenylate cyclase
VAEPKPAEPGHRTFIGTVVFIDIVDYSQRPVLQQVELKTRLNEMIAGVLEHVPTADRMSLDTGDGAALCFLGDPEDALFAASNLRAAAAGAGPELALRVGINLGPLRIVRDVNGRPNILGDGINVAQRVMSFARPNQILVSRSYYEIVSRLSQEYARLFQYLGIHRDKHVREHEVYAMTVATPGGGGEEPAAPPPAAEGGQATDSSEFVPAASARFDAEALGAIERALAQSIGPLARVLVRRTAARARDLPDLCQQLAASVPEGSQAAFRARLGDLAGAREPQAPPKPGPAAPSPARPAPAAAPGGRPLSPEALAEATERLAVYLGPVARVLVKRAAEGAANTRDLYQRLLRHIDDPGQRDRFAAATEELSDA